MSRVYCEHYHPIDEGFGDCPECEQETERRMTRLVQFIQAADALAEAADVPHPITVSDLNRLREALAAYREARGA